MSRNYIRKILFDTDTPTSGNSEVVELDGCDVGTLQIIAGAVEAADTFQQADVNIANDTVTLTGHTYYTGVVGQLTTTGTLPAGLSLATNYWIIEVDDNTVKFATSLANAQAGTAVDITSTGSGGATHTFTPSAKSGSIQPQVTNVDNPAEADWISKGSATTLTGAAQNVATEYDRKEVSYSRFRVKYTHTTGSFDFRVYVNFKE